MKVNYGILNKSVDKVIKDENNNQYKLLEAGSKKVDEGENYILYPPINPSTAKYFYQNSPILFKCINALSEDLTLGEISSNNKEIRDFWFNNQDELYYLCKDYLLYGYGCAEILKDLESDKTVAIKQIPADTIKLIKYNDSVYVQQSINGKRTTLTIHGEIYNVDNMRDDVEGTCIWIGGDEGYKHFSLPKWYSARHQIATNIVISELNIDNINNGNLLSGVLAISGGRQITIEGDISFEEKLKRQFSNVGTGLAVTYVENGNRDQELEMEYINLTNNNYDYIRRIYEDNEQSILECWFMPKLRLLNNENRESMNSNKSEIIWNIYLRSCNNIQSNYLTPIHRFNRYFFKTKDKLNIALPTFEDQTSVVVNNAKILMELGLMSKKDAIEYINAQNIDVKLSVPDDYLSESYIENSGENQEEV